MKNEYFIIDRIEEDIAVCECQDRSMIYIELERLYHGAKTGDHFFQSNDIYHFDEIATQQAKNKNIALQKSLFTE